MDNEKKLNASNVRRRQIVKAVIWSVRFGIFSIIIAAFLGSVSVVSRATVHLSPLLFLSGTFQNSETQSSSNASGLIGAITTSAASLIILLCLLKKRFFCRFVCPLGLCVDVAANIRRKTFRTRFGRYGLVFSHRRFFAFFSFFWFCSTAPLLFFPEVASPISAFAFDPMAILSQTLNSLPKATPLLLIFLICFLISPYFWRFQFCPCGAVQELLYLPKTFVQKRLKHIKKERLHEEKTQSSIASRRNFWAMVGILSLSPTIAVSIKKRGLSLKKFFFRPPGVTRESEFLAKCARCGRCVKACPNEILTLVNFSNGVNSSSEESVSPKGELANLSLLDKAILVGTPIVDFARGAQFCEKDCDVCSQACPTGAIFLADIADKKVKSIGIAKFEMEHCMLYYEQECSICRRECPYGAIDLVWLEEEYLELPTIDENICVGCGRCVVTCPGEPIFLNDGEYVDPGATTRVRALSIVQKSQERIN